MTLFFRALSLDAIIILTVDLYKKTKRKKEREEGGKGKGKVLLSRKQSLGERREEEGGEKLRKKKKYSEDEERLVFLILHDAYIETKTPPFAQSRTSPGEKEFFGAFFRERFLYREREREKDREKERLVGRQGRRSPTTQIVHTPAVFHTLRRNRAPSESSGIYDFSR